MRIKNEAPSLSDLILLIPRSLTNLRREDYLGLM